MLELFDVSQISQFSATTAAIIVVLAVLLYSFKDRGLPPGPTGIPLLGYYPFLEHETVHLQLEKLAKKYGDVFSFRVTGQLYIHIGTLKALREAHVTKADCFNRRLMNFSVMKYIFGEGLVFDQGEKWRVLRKFFVQTLKDYGLSSFKGSMAGPISDSLSSIMEDIRNSRGQPFDAINLLTSHCTSTMRQLVFGSVEIAKKDLDALNEAYTQMIDLMRGKLILLAGPVAEHVILPLSSGHKRMTQSKKLMNDILFRIILEHESTYNEDHPRDVIDCYIRERKLRASKSDPTSRYFTAEGLVPTLEQFVGDGALGVAFFVSSFLLTVVNHPEVQEKMYSEIIEVIGPDRIPTYEDRSKLPYTNAAMLETLRTSDFFPVFPSLECTRETTLNGYKIPKGSVTLVSNWAIQHDSRLYEDPYTFDPERYIAKPGKPKAESPMLFGVGKRSCAGESFAMTQAFLFLVTIVKSFKVTLAPEGTKKSDWEMYLCAHPRE